MTTKQTLLALAERVEKGKLSNSIDVEVEIALFDPCQEWASVRPNFSRSKVIYTNHDGLETTHWALEWTMNRKNTAERLRAKAEMM